MGHFLLDPWEQVTYTVLYGSLFILTLVTMFTAWPISGAIARAGHFLETQLRVNASPIL